ncbi:MAG: sulfite exporter TauE/SafE family protein [Deltaproteobacteria bacterium]|nr:sulfite exporter TauE/SafE family protein [Deltaproteobacteria bacterium]
MDSLWALVPLFFATAFIYSMAGFGGGSTYLALLVLFSLPHIMIPKVALLCNLVVVTGGSYFFIKEGHFSFKKTVPFIVASIPAAYWGGTVLVQKEMFQLLLGFSLLAAALRMFLSESAFTIRSNVSWKSSWLIGLPLGFLLGGLAGLVGIGGGIFLSPILYFLGWTNAKQTAASSSVFILVNSVSGLIGQFAKEATVPPLELLLPLALAVLVGGAIGSRLGSQRLPKLILQRVTSALIFWVSLRLLHQGFLLMT